MLKSLLMMLLYQASSSILQHHHASTSVIKHNQAASSITKHHQAHTWAKVDFLAPKQNQTKVKDLNFEQNKPNNFLASLQEHCLRITKQIFTVFKNENLVFVKTKFFKYHIFGKTQSQIKTNTSNLQKHKYQIDRKNIKSQLNNKYLS